MSPSGAFDAEDLLALAPPALQRALLKVPDDLVAQALAGAPAAVAERVLANLSARRAAAIRSTTRRLLASRELGPASAATALRNLIRRVFEISAPEAQGAEASRSVGTTRSAPAGPGDREAGSGPPSQPGPDLTEGGFVRLREARAVFEAARRMSPYVQGLERAKLGANAGVLIRSWLKALPRGR
ncbi:MAG TPA: FliG C-terminal domain-containing protein [Planctomycetota bacterium]|nr:FliG C-terminal domain-containing protein [Planctomycetota bacterium]